jgi:cytochrome b561
MLSAARYPIVLIGPVHLPFILPHDATLYAILRRAHTVIGYLYFLTFLAHFGAILFHTLIVRDGILKRMAPWNIGPPKDDTGISAGSSIPGR